MVAYRNILFDLDGTLTDPQIGITKSIQFAMSELGLKPTPAQDLIWCIGPPMQESFPQILQTTNPALIEKGIQLYRKRYGEIGMFENVPYTGIHESLQKLADKGKKLFVATSKPWFYAKKIIEYFKLNRFFAEVYGSELDGTRGNKADLIAYLLRNEKLNSNSAIMVGDREHDILGAKKNHLPALGVTYGYGSAKELLHAGAISLCDSPNALLDFFV